MGDRDLVARGWALLEAEPGADLRARRRSLLLRLHPDQRGNDSGRADLEAVLAASRARGAAPEVLAVECAGLGIRVTWSG